MQKLHRVRRGLIIPGVILLSAAVVLALAFNNRGDSRHLFGQPADFVPAFLPIYEIEAVSGTHEASILNLGLPYVGAPQVPIPVDINGDLLPDVTVGVNIVNAEGVFNNPPRPGEVLAPNIDINRLITAPILTPGADPLRINIKFTVFDLSGENPDIVVRFGYDTGDGGSIPPAYKALVAGLDTLFNPITARVDVTGGLLIGIDPHLPDLGLSPQTAAYSGPLTTWAALDTGPKLRVNADMRFEPVPHLLELTYGTDDATQQIDLAHFSWPPTDVDLGITGRVELGEQDIVADLDARIDRLPRKVAVDFATAGDQGAIRYESDSANGRLPDLSAQIDMRQGGERPLEARVDMEALPDLLTAEWDLPDGQPPSVTFDASGQGIGAVEARIQNYDGEPTAFTPWVPGERQHVSIQAGPEGVFEGDTLIQARVERIRSATIGGTPEGNIAGQVQIGDGERSFEIHGEIDLRPDGLPYINATATLSPLPDTLDFELTPIEAAGDDPEAEPEKPLSVFLAPSESMDVDVDAIIGLPGTQGAVSCGDGGTACATLQIRNVPTSIRANVVNHEDESRIEIDAVPRAGAAPLDVFGQVTLGPVDADLGPLTPLVSKPIHAEFAAQGLPAHVRVRAVQDGDDNLERVDVRTCEFDYETNQCTGPEGELAELTFEVRNFDDRPANLPAPPQSGPLYVTAVARGTTDTEGNSQISFEATGRMTDLRGLSFVNKGDLAATKVDVGGNRDFRVFVDADDIDIDGGDTSSGLVDVDLDMRVNRMPSPFTFCFAQNGRPLPTGTPAPDPITAPCEAPDPFGDGSATASPLTIAYDAPAPFDVIVDATVEGDIGLEMPESVPVDFGTFNRIDAHVALTDIPSQFTAYVGSPADQVAPLDDDGLRSTATRVRTVAPGATNTELDLDVAVTTDGVDCNDPNPVGGALCTSVDIEQLPEFTSALYATRTDPGPLPDPDAVEDDTIVDQRIEVHACDRRFFDAAPDCVPGTAGSIGAIEAKVRAHAGEPADNGVPPYVAPADQPYISAQGALVDLANLEFDAAIRVEDIRHVQVRTNSEGTTAATDIGDDNAPEPLTIHAYADTTNASVALPDDALRARAVADIELDPLPEVLGFRLTGPGKDQADDTELDITASAASLLTLSAEMREAGVAADADCGRRGTYCADVTIDRLPQHVNAVIERNFGALVDEQRDVTTRIKVLQERFDEFDDKADITVNTAFGLPFTAPVIGDGSIYADLALSGVPDRIAVALDQHEVYEDDAETLESSSIERFQIHACERDFANEECDGPEDQLDQVEISARTFRLRPTDFPAPPSPVEAPIYIGAAGRGNQLEAVVRIPAISEAQFLNKDGVTAATARIGGTQPLQVRVDIQDLPLGESGPLPGESSEFLPFGDIGIADPSVSIDATVDVTPFPGDLSFCMRNGNLPMPAEVLGLDFTATCEQTDPFDSDGDDDFTEDAGLEETPLSVGFDANTSFDVDVDASISIDGFDAANPTEALPTQRVFGKLALDDLPSDLAFHFLQPVADEVDPDGEGPEEPIVQQSGPYHGVIRTPGATSGIDLTLAAGYLIGADTICEDPRPNRSATCVSFGEFGNPGVPGIENLPTEAEFFYNPDLDPYSLTAAQLADPAVMTNFTVHTEGTAATEFNTLRISSVNPPIDLPALEVPLLGELAADAFVAEIDLDALPDPFDLRGTLLLTDESPTATFEVLDGPAPGVDTIPGATVHVRNFLSPDPTAGAIVPDRPVEDDPTLETYTISAFQRGPAAKVDAEIVDVQSFGLRPVRSGDANSAHFRHPLGTTVINAGFEGDFNIRAFVDLLPEPGLRIIGDVLIGDIPREVEVCVRGPRPTDPGTGLPMTDAPITGTGTWCDDPANIDPGEGGLEIAQTPNTFGRRMDVDAFARLQYGGGSSVFAGRVDIRQMPQIIRARIPGTVGKDVEVSTFSWGGIDGTLAIPDGINRIAFEAASFDLDDADTGYSSALPYQPIAGPIEAKEAPGGTGTFGPGANQEFLFAAADLSAGTDTVENIGFHVRGQIGLDDDTAPSSQLQHLLYSGDKCEAPVGPDGVTPRQDFPAIPDGDSAAYKCIRVDFEEPTPGVNPLAIDAFALLPGQNVLALHDAGLSDLPPWIQIQLAEAETFTDPDNQRGWRRPCPSLGDVAADPSRAGGCMAPKIRFDQPATSFLFGRAEFGHLADLPRFDSPATDPVQPAPDFDAVPTASGWANVVGGVEQNNFAEGVRLKVLDFDGNTITNIDDDRVAARAGIRIQVPGSFQMEQVQKFGLDLRQKNQDGEHIAGDKAEDMRVAFTVRNPNGTLKTSVGDLAAMLHLVDSNAQILLTQPCPASQDILGDEPSEQGDLARATPRAACNEYKDGIPLPGHVALTLYLRSHLENVSAGGDDKLRSSTFIQVDGRISAAMSIGARLYGNGAALLSGGPTEGVFTGDGAITAGTAEVAIRNLPSSGSNLGSHVYDPDFRFRAELISDGDRPEDDPDPSTFSETGTVDEDSGCSPCLDEWFEFNFFYNIGIERAFAGFDMHPPGSSTAAAKQLDAVIYLNTPKIGADLQAFTQIGGPSPAEISLGVGVAVSPLNFEVKSKSNIGANLDALVRHFIEETLGAPGWLADIISFILKPITAAIDAILNALPVGVELDSDLFIQFQVNRLSEFTLRNNILHTFMDGEGDGHANFGPINWYIDKFSGGLYLDIPKIKIPKYICWVPGIPCSIDPPAILLLGYGYADGLPIGDLGVPILMDFRDCDAAGGVGSIIPFIGGGFDNTVQLDPLTGADDGWWDRSSINEFLTGGDDEDFVTWVGTDPRMSFGGLLLRAADLLTFGGFTTALDFVLDLVVGPVVCNIDFFSIDQEQNLFPGVAYTTDQNTYHPGTENANLFPGHPVPGQVGTPLRLPEATEAPPVGEILFPPPDPSNPPVPEPPTPPEGLNPLYAGTDADIATDIALCGVHEFNTFEVLAGADVTVATAANMANVAGDGPACPAADVGSLEIRANTITVASSGSIRGDAISTDIPDLSPEPDPDLPPPNDFEALYRATGSSGGTNAGVGNNGSAPEAGFQNYDGATTDLVVFPGGPGSSVGTGFDLQSIAPAVAAPDTVDSAGPGGLGGGTILLRADSGITINGTVTANGGDGASNTDGACDNDPDDNGIPGHQTFDHDDDPDTPPILNPVLDPPWEHTAGHIGSGGGAGGGISIFAERGTVSFGGSAVLEAHGGSGGSGRLGSGGGGGGGAIKVVAPIFSGVSTGDLNVAGGSDGSTALLCQGIPTATAQTFDNPLTPAEETDPLPHDGVAPIVERPVAELRPYGPFWWGGGAQAPEDTFDAHLVGAASPGSTVHVCSVRVPIGSTYDADPLDGETDNPLTPWDDTRDDAIPTESESLGAALSRALPRQEVDDDGNTVTFGTMPSGADPCGSPAPDSRINAQPGGGGVVITEVESASFSGTNIATPVTVPLDIDATHLHGLYTVVIHGGAVEALTPVEWAIGVDATPPNAEILSPVDTPTPSTNVAGVTVDYVADDILVADVFLVGVPVTTPVPFPAIDVIEDQEFTLSGLNRTECRIYPSDTLGSSPGPEEGWERCSSGTFHELHQPDGTKTIEVRAFDSAVTSGSGTGSVSIITGPGSDVDGDGFDGQADIVLDISPPEATLTLGGGVQGGLVPAEDLVRPEDAGERWYREAPSLTISDYTSESPANAVPYVFRVDNGAERGCPGDDPPDHTPPDCVLTATEVANLLSIGGHTIHYSAVNETGNRYRDDNNALTPSPMPTEPLYLDDEPPVVEISTIPLEPDQVHNGDDWFSKPVIPFVAAIDQFGGSGIDYIRAEFNDPTPDTAFNPMAPLPAPAGSSTFNFEVADIAGNVVTGSVDINVDADPPAFTLAASGGVAGLGGWYTTAPSFAVSDYDDNEPTGVGIDAGHFRTRVDNGFVETCDAPTCGFDPGLTTGTHLVHAAAIDRFGNLSGETTLTVRVDLEPPVIAPVIGPADPDGKNGWWHTGPFLTLFADDPGDGSGLDPATLQYSLNGPGGPFTTWTEPVRVGAGEHTLCWRAADRAGNENPGGCRDFFVDLDDPNTTINAPADPASGWFTGSVVLAATNNDPVPGSGFVPPNNPADVCEDVTPVAGATNIAGLCVSVDRGPYRPYTGAITAGEGIHTVLAFSVDRSGRRGPVAERTVKVDNSAPVVELRRLPRDPAESVFDWYRVLPLIVMRADDGYQGSGVTALEYRVQTDAGAFGPWVPYTEPFELQTGKHTVETRATDMVGSRTASTTVKVDTVHPTAEALRPQKILWLRLLGLGGPNNLNFRVGDNLSGNLKVSVIIYDATQNPVRRLDTSLHVPPGTTATGSVSWDGRDGSLLNLVPLGVYYYRVVVIDEAGHVTQSGESEPITIRLL